MGKWTWVSYNETTKYSVQHDVCINVGMEMHDHLVSNSFKLSSRYDQLQHLVEGISTLLLFVYR